MKPCVLYKYFPPERIDVLYDRRIRFTPPVEFNDPYDSSPSTENVERSRLKKSLPTTGLGSLIPENERAEFENRREQLLKQTIELENKGKEWLKKFKSEIFGVLSLSIWARSLPMWAYYAANHSGFLIAFDARHEFFKEERWAVGIRYSPSRPNFSDADISSLWSKSLEWSHEQEHRAFRELKNADKVLPGGIHLFTYSLKAIKAIVLGCRSSERLEREFRILIKRPDYSHIRLMKMDTNDKNFKLMARQL